ncbi:three-Cys-motif partner protein TcmP [Candidatus Poriferisodalis multihospitum]|uniref:three-Cys-motif partner protein TcmP n=1 Tax=Candidatus Poriferisodalis multihospitum TaxID=2983191 RepID=UPI002B2605E0|nr:three-Cys-motif partner protein TcmP [Candidatus Poriferisodalis multihospitum]
MRDGERPRSWGFWTEVKLDALARYLPQFTTASRSARSTLYLDLFAGSVNNVRRDDEDRHFFGSTVRALETEPGFSTLRFFELDPNAAHLKKQLRERYPNDDRFRVIQGDCNKTIAGCLAGLRDDGLDWAPTFCFVDPDGLDVNWSTLQALAQFKNSRARTKAEMLILLPHTSIPRLAGWDNAMGVDDTLSVKITSLLGSDSWRAIDDRRQSNDLAASEARHLYLSLFRFKLERELGYRKTLTIEMGNERGNPVYVLVFATDHSAGDRIMSSVFRQAREQSAEYRAELRERRQRERDERAGLQSLFGADELAEEAAPVYMETTELSGSAELPDWLLHRIERD